jgi:hypothetical protein
MPYRDSSVWVPTWGSRVILLFLRRRSSISGLSLAWIQEETHSLGKTSRPAEYNLPLSNASNNAS